MHLPFTPQPIVHLILPDQLFEVSLPGTRILVEEHLWYRQFRFPLARLLHQRMAGLDFCAHLQRSGTAVFRIETGHPLSDIRQLVPALAAAGVREVHLWEVNDDWFNQRLKRACATSGIQIHTHPSPGFLTNTEDAAPWLRQRGRYYQTGFYTWQRKRLGILVENQQPAGGKWTFDTENRKKLPTSVHPPAPKWPEWTSIHEQEARKIKAEFPENPDNLEWFRSRNFFFPVTREESRNWLSDFLESRLSLFGEYEDAMTRKSPWVFHSLLSPLMNLGLLTPDEVIEAAISHASRHQVPLNSLEGFIRQIIGWREFIRLIYLDAGRKQRTRNFFGFTHALPVAFWSGETGVVPVDDCIHKVKESGYLHHIERLMVTGNFLLLCEVNPEAVYEWFMTAFMDSYDWVMVPNVYGMSQYADGGMMTTKPYIASSNYIRKMSDYPSGKWTKVMDALFWRFMSVHREVFGNNPRTAMLLKTWEKKGKSGQNALLSLAEGYLEKLRSGLKIRL